MEFSLNSPILYVIVGAILLLVMGQSVFFLVRAWKAGKEMGLKTSTLRKTVVSAALFTIAPAIAILVSVVILSKSLGVALPWLRLSVIGSMVYETMASDQAITAIRDSEGLAKDAPVTLTGDQFLSVSIVMTLGIIVGLILVPILCKRIRRGVDKLQKKDTKWGDLLMVALFMGMISAFLGYIFTDVRAGLAGWAPVFIMIVSAVAMALFGLLIKVTKWRWLSDYALPVCLLVGMLSAIPITAWTGVLGGN